MPIYLIGPGGTKTIYTASEYFDKVYEILESFYYQELIYEFSADDVAQSMAATMTACHALLVSPRFCAVVIWSATMNQQIMPKAAQSTKH